MNIIGRYVITLILAELWLCGCVFSAALNLSEWTPLNYDNTTAPTSIWILQAGDTMVTQTQNSDPSLFLNNTEQTNYSMLGSFRVSTNSDNDYIGFAFGFADSSNLYLFAWKKALQGAHPAGFAIRKISAPSVDSLTADDFENGVTTEYSANLVSLLGPSCGRAYYTTYDFNLTVEPDSTVWYSVPSGFVYYLASVDVYSIWIDGAPTPELLIEPGNNIKLLPPCGCGFQCEAECYLTVGSGILPAYGVSLTARGDDSLCGDSNGNGLSSEQAHIYRSPSVHVLAVVVARGSNTIKDIGDT